MKTLFRFCLVLLLVGSIALVAGYFLITNAGFQKRLIESKLPEGSSIRSVHITTGTLELSELVLALVDGTRVRVAAVETTFKPLAALFDNTIELGVLEVDGLRVDLPAAVVAAPSGETAPQVTSPKQPSGKPADVKVEDAAKPWESIYQIGNLDWLFDVEQINLNGKLKDAAGTVYAFTVSSGAIRPGLATSMEASLQLVSSEPIQSGLKGFDSEAKLTFLQKQTGGFESLRLESHTSGKDARGASVLTVTQVLELSIKGFDQTADLTVQFNADLKRPDLFLPELASFGALTLEGQVVASVEGEAMTVSSAGLVASADGARVLELDLKQSLTLGGKQSFAGELLDVKITSLPLAWLDPWLPEGLLIEGAPISTQIALSGDAAGALELRAHEPIRLGPLTVRQDDSTALEEVSFVIDPVIHVDADQSINYSVKTFQLTDRYGEVISGEATGSYKASDASSANPFNGLKAEAKLNVGLQELFQQPLLEDKASLVAGSLALNLNVDGTSDYPLRAQGEIRGLRPREMPGQMKNYRFAAQLKAADIGVWALGANFEAGSADRPSTSLQLSGQANMETVPLAFTVGLSGKVLAQEDLTILTAAFSPAETKSTPVVARPSVAPSRTAQPADVSAGPIAPPWAGFKGNALIKLDAVKLESGHTITGVAAQAVVSEPLLKLSGVTAKMGSGSLKGGADLRYAANTSPAYDVLADLNFTQVDPSLFADKRSGKFPVQGLFDGAFKLTGRGQSLEAALEDSVADLIITGKGGVLTAFELDNRSQLGLGIAGILGQSFDRPGVTALSNTVPYFKDIRYDDFIFELKRGNDKRMLIPQFKLTGESLLIDASGFVAASKLSEVMDQPLDLKLALGAKGRLINHLETLKLLQPATGEDGFRRWNKDVKIGGTLADPDTDALMDILSDAAKAAFSKPAEVAPTPSPTEGAPQEQAPTPVKKSKEERRRDDVEMGLDLLNTILGN